jgi:hypothetical protein
VGLEIKNFSQTEEFILKTYKEPYVLHSEKPYQITVGMCHLLSHIENGEKVPSLLLEFIHRRFGEDSNLSMVLHNWNMTYIFVQNNNNYLRDQIDSTQRYVLKSFAEEAITSVFQEGTNAYIEASDYVQSIFLRQYYEFESMKSQTYLLKK